MESLQRKQLEKRFSALRNLKHIPQKGWIRTIRDLYHMSAEQLAFRAGVSRVSISQFEKSEKMQTITLKNLFKVADAINCDVHYALVPRAPIHEFCNKMAKVKAREMVMQIQETMKLEDQALTSEDMHELYQEILKDLEKNPSKIWGKLSD